MQVIPAINCKDFLCVQEKLEQIRDFAEWAHIDVADGKFTKNVTWGSPQDLKDSKFFTLPNFAEAKLGRARVLNSKFFFEVHLMVLNVKEAAEAWVKSGAKRIIAHFETLESSKLTMSDVVSSYDTGCRKIEAGIALKPETTVSRITPYLKAISFVQVLAVAPGMAGQEFDERVLEKIRFLKTNYPAVTIEVDGGINLETAKLAKEAGADIAVSASYIFESPNPIEAYQALCKI